MRQIRHEPTVFLLLVIFFLALHNLKLMPYPWFDEGWVLSLARNWVVLGHYGYLLQGELVPATILNAGLPVTSPIALSFHYLGIGIWQGRLPSVFFLMGVCALTYHLAKRLYGRKIAIWTIVALLLLPIHPGIHPIFMGRQAMGEMPLLFYVMFGYALLFANWRKSIWHLTIAPIFFALALQAKPQFLPFFVVSLVIPVLWLIWQRNWPEARYLLVSLLLTFVLNFSLSQASESFLNSAALSDTSGGDPYAMTRQWEVLLTYVFVFDPVYRLNLLSNVYLLITGLPVLIGIIYTATSQRHQLNKEGPPTNQFIWTLILWVFVTSWFIWFYFLSIGFIRYLFPAFVVGIIFMVKAFYEITSGFNFQIVLKTMAKNVTYRTLNLESGILFLATVLLSMFSLIAILILSTIFYHEEDVYEQVLTFLNNETSPTALIETYDSELFVMLERDYHYPPDAIQHALNQNLLLGKGVVVDYAPSALEIECVVIGWARIWPLYLSLLQERRFVLAYENDNYQVYCDRASPAAQNKATLE